MVNSTAVEDGISEMKVKLLDCVRLFSTTWTAACQAPLSMEFSRLEYWSGLPFPSPGKPNDFPLRLGIRQECLLLPLLSNIILKDLVQ